MNFDLTEDQQAFREAARAFAQKSMAPFAAQWDQDSIFSNRGFSRSGRNGLLRALHARSSRRHGAVTPGYRGDCGGTGRGLSLYRRVYNHS